MQLSIRIPYFSSLSLSRNAKVFLGILAGLSISILAAGYLLNRRRKRYRAISTTSSDGTTSRSSGTVLQRMSTFRGNGIGHPSSTPFHSVNSAPHSRRLEREAPFSPESDSSLYSSAGELPPPATHSTPFSAAGEQASATGRRERGHALQDVEPDGSLPSSLLPQQQQQQQEDKEDKEDKEETTIALTTSELVESHKDDISRGYESDTSSASFHSTFETTPPLAPSPPAHVTLDRNHLYNSAMEQVNLGGVKCRNIRTKMLCCTSDTDFLAKLFCVRLAFDDLLTSSKREYIVQLCRDILASFIRSTEQDPNPFCECYDDMAMFLSDDANKLVATNELIKRKVVCMNVYDVVLDFILLDAFEDVDSPPSTVVIVLQNRWITDGMKKAALSAAIWSILKAKKSLLRNKNGFMSRFYVMSQVLSPTLAWGFMGTNMELKEKCCTFRDGVMEFVCGMFSLEAARYTTVQTLSEDIFQLAQQTADKMIDNHS